MNAGQQNPKHWHVPKVENLKNGFFLFPYKHLLWANENSVKIFSTINRVISIKCLFSVHTLRSILSDFPQLLHFYSRSFFLTLLECANWSALGCLDD